MEKPQRVEPPPRLGGEPPPRLGGAADVLRAAREPRTVWTTAVNDGGPGREPKRSANETVAGYTNGFYIGQPAALARVRDTQRLLSLVKVRANALVKLHMSSL